MVLLVLLLLVELVLGFIYLYIFLVIDPLCVPCRIANEFFTIIQAAEKLCTKYELYIYVVG